MRLLFDFPSRAWSSWVVVHVGKTLWNHLWCSWYQWAETHGGFLGKSRNELTFRFAQLAFHLFCKEPTMTHSLWFQFNYAVCGFKFHSVCSVYQGLLQEAGQFLFDSRMSILWWIIPESYLPNDPLSRLFIPQYSNKHLVWGYDPVKNNNSRDHKLGGSWLAIPLSCLLSVLVWFPQHRWDKDFGGYLLSHLRRYKWGQGEREGW